MSWETPSFPSEPSHRWRTFSDVLCFNMSDIEEAPFTSIGLSFKYRISRVELLQSAAASFIAPSLLMQQSSKHNFLSTLFSINVLATAVTPTTFAPIGLKLKSRAWSVVFLRSPAASSTAPSLLMWQSRKLNPVSVHLDWSLSIDVNLSTFAMLK